MASDAAMPSATLCGASNAPTPEVDDSDDAADTDDDEDDDEAAAEATDDGEVSGSLLAADGDGASAKLSRRA
jgi:hypothetical protein